MSSEIATPDQNATPTRKSICCSILRSRALFAIAACLDAQRPQGRRSLSGAGAMTDSAPSTPVEDELPPASQMNSLAIGETPTDAAQDSAAKKKKKKKKSKKKAGATATGESDQHAGVVPAKKAAAPAPPPPVRSGGQAPAGFISRLKHTRYISCYHVSVRRRQSCLRRCSSFSCRPAHRALGFNCPASSCRPCSSSILAQPPELLAMPSPRALRLDDASVLQTRSSRRRNS